MYQKNNTHTHTKIEKATKKKKSEEKLSSPGNGNDEIAQMNAQNTHKNNTV